MPPDSAPTKARLLEAAFEEFARYGLAGARVDRIAEAARANKRLIYVYYGNKEHLFEAVFLQRAAELAEAAPFTADDLPGYAGALFDYIAENPGTARILSWGQLERQDPFPVETDNYRAKVEALAAVQQQGAIRGGIPPADLLALLLGMVTSWFNASPALQDLASGDPWSPERLQRHRASLVAAVERLVAPGPGLNPGAVGDA